MVKTNKTQSKEVKKRLFNAKLTMQQMIYLYLTLSGLETEHS